MTSPDFITPPKAFNANTLFGLQDATKEGEAAAANEWLRDALEEVRNRLWNDLLGGYNNIVEGIGDGIEAIVLAIIGMPGGLAELQSFIASLTTAITTNTEAIAELEDIAPATPVTPAYVADIDDMASCARGELIEWYATSSGGSHSHSYDASGGGSSFATTGNSSPGVTVNVLSRTPLFTPDVQKDPFGTGGKVYYWPIVADRKGHASLLHWNVGEDSSLLDIVEYNMALCVYNPVNGNIEKVWDSGNLASSLSATTTAQEAEIDMALTEAQGAVTPGQILFVAHRQRAQGLLMQPRSIAYAPRTTRQRPASNLLRAPSYVTPAYYTGIPSSIALSSLTYVLNRLPWSGIKVEAAA